jgi:2-hydroxy-3-keto-5-methylthiopentenyl-1-phosphate phosphatase
MSNLNAAPRPAPAPNQPIAVPEAARAQVWIDFDGTLTSVDLLDELIGRYSRNDSWRLVEERWRAGLIGSRECLEQEFALLDISRGELAEELARVPLDPGAVSLLAFLERARVPVAILSDGVESFIRAILKRAGVTAPTIRSNRAAHRGRRITLSCPHSARACESGSAHCKCASRERLSDAGRSCIYIGDGRSDLCAARKVDVVFAKGELAAALTREGREFVPFTTLADVHAALVKAWGPGERV